MLLRILLSLCFLFCSALVTIAAEIKIINPPEFVTTTFALQPGQAQLPIAFVFDVDCEVPTRVEWGFSEAFSMSDIFQNGRTTRVVNLSAGRYIVRIRSVNCGSNETKTEFIVQ